MPFTKIRKTILIIALVLLSGGIGFRMGEQETIQSSYGQNIRNAQTPPEINVDFSQFWDVWRRVHRYHIDRDKIDNQKLVWGAIIGMVNAIGDPFTSFLPPKENTEFKQDLNGSFEGIGAQLGLKDNRIIVIAPIQGSPAEKQGILTGDYILKVNDEDTLNWSVNQAVAKIRGPKGSTVKLNILHENSDKPVDITIKRDTINVPSVESWVKKVQDIKEISGLTGTDIKLPSGYLVNYIHLSRFGDRLAEDWQTALDVILKQGNVSHGVIFDLRNNPGGYLDGSVYIGSEFIKSGTVVTQENSDGSRQIYQVNREGQLTDVPIVVLINKGSASAAEIVAGALKDYKRAIIVGETSYGKGSVQTPQDLSGGAGLHITTGRWLTPNGNSISAKGIKPDIEVPNTDYTATRDAQLKKAIEVLFKK